jgi:hypothetical protein
MPQFNFLWFIKVQWNCFIFLERIQEVSLQPIALLVVKLPFVMCCYVIHVQSINKKIRLIETDIQNAVDLISEIHFCIFHNRDCKENYFLIQWDGCSGECREGFFMSRPCSWWIRLSAETLRLAPDCGISLTSSCTGQRVEQSVLSYQDLCLDRTCRLYRNNIHLHSILLFIFTQIPFRSVGLAKACGCWMAEESWFPFPTGSRNCYFLHSLQTDFGAHRASYPMGTGGSFPRSKAPEQEPDHSHSCNMLKCLSAWLCTSTPPYVSLAWCLIN